MTSTPANVAIPVRNVYFNRDTTLHARWWHGDDPVATAFFNALSCTFPAGEKFFMDSVRRYRDVVDPVLRAQIKGFIGQEAVHSREHDAFNAMAADSGYDVAKLEDRTRRVLDFARTRKDVEQLAATCALEHFTAILAHALLSEDGRDMDAAPADAARLWSWHAMEEIEHKAVAFDTFLFVTKDWSGVRRYRQRIRAMILATLILFSTMKGNMGDLYRADGINGPRTWWRTAKFLLGRPGILRRIARPYFAYFRPSYHPWQHDDRALLAATETKLALVTA